MESNAPGSGVGAYMTSGWDGCHSHESMEDQGRHQGNGPGVDHATDVYSSERRFFAAQVVLQYLVADGYGCLGLIRGVLV